MKNLVFFLFLLAAATASFGQTLTDLNSEVYQDLERWENQGFIHELPLLKPYSGIMLSTLLKEADEKGTASVKAKIAKYRQRYLKPFQFPNLDLRTRNITNSTDYFSDNEFNVQENGMLGEYAHLDGQYHVFFFLTSLSSANITPLSVASIVSPINTDLGLEYNLDQTSFSVRGQSLAVTPNYETLLGVGNSVVSFQTGFTRSAFADYAGDSVILSPHASEAAHYSFTWKSEWTVYSSLLLALTATPWNGSGGAHPNKFLSFSSFQWRMNDFYEFDCHQSVVYGERFAPEYLIPGFPFLNTEQTGNWDNLFLGLGSRFFFPGDIKASAQIYLDDFTIMKVLLGDTNTRFKAAIQANVQWSPRDSFLDHLGLDYTVIMPYMYTHNPEFVTASANTAYSAVKTGTSLPNYVDYTHNGAGLGSNLGPNSDRILLNARFNGPLDSTISASTSFSRHGNASEGATLGYLNYLGANQGTIFDSGYDPTTGNKIFDSVKFLDQKTIQLVWQTTLGFKIPLPSESWTLTPECEVTGEWVWNRNLQQGNNGFGLYVYFGTDWLF